MEVIRLKIKEILCIINYKIKKNFKIFRDFMGGRNYYENNSGILLERERERNS